MVISVIKKAVGGIDRFSDMLGQIVKFLILALIFVLCYEVVSRYVFNRPTVWALETSKMIFGTIGAMCWGYTLKIGGHVRVDVFYTMFSRRGKALVDVLLSLIFLLPFEIVLIYTGYKWAFFALKTQEKMIDSSWMPPSAPFRFILAIGFTFFFIQTLAEFTKHVYALITGQELIEKDENYGEEGLL